MLEEIMAVRRETLTAISEVLRLRESGVVMSPAEMAAGIGATIPRTPPRSSSGAVAVVPLFGLLTPRGGGLLQMLFGGTSLAAWSADVRRAAADPAIAEILVVVDSPGGDVQGMQEAADVLYAARQRKRVTAVASHTAASCAYCIASQAHELIVSPSGQVGSIGVYGTHVDVSRLSERMGVKHTIVSAGARKADGNQYEPLSDTARADMQKRVDTYYDAFVAAVARGRGVSQATVRGGFGQGGIVLAQEAARLRMADRVATLEDALTQPSRRAGTGDAASRWEFELAALGIDSEPKPMSDERARYRLELARRGL